MKLCHHYPFVGNCLELNPFDIWHSAKAEEIKKAIQACKKNCSHLRCYYQQNVFDVFKIFYDSMRLSR